MSTEETTFADDGDLWADDKNYAGDGTLWEETEAARRTSAPVDLRNTDLGDVPQQWIDRNTIAEAPALQDAADAGLLPLDSDGDGVIDAGEFMADTDPLDPDDARSLGRTEDYDPALGGDPDAGLPAII